VAKFMSTRACIPVNISVCTGMLRWRTTNMSHCATSMRASWSSRRRRRWRRVSTPGFETQAGGFLAAFHPAGRPTRRGGCFNNAREPAAGAPFRRGGQPFLLCPRRSSPCRRGLPLLNMDATGAKPSPTSGRVSMEQRPAEKPDSRDYPAKSPGQQTEKVAPLALTWSTYSCRYCRLS
jgi:hypothetical protein